MRTRKANFLYLLARKYGLTSDSERQFESGRGNVIKIKIQSDKPVKSKGILVKELNANENSDWVNPNDEAFTKALNKTKSVSALNSFNTAIKGTAKEVQEQAYKKKLEKRIKELEAEKELKNKIKYKVE